MAEQTYRSRSVIVENNIIQLLKATLNTAHSSNEMFSMFEKFGFLLERPNVRSALQEYQTQLLSVVQDQLSDFQKQFQVQLSVQKVIQMRDVPSFSSTLMWVNEMNYRLEFLVDKLELVLTKDWSRYPEGKRIYSEVTLLQEKLQPQKIIAEWIAEITKELETPITRQHILFIERQIASKELSLMVNFDERAFSLAEEVHNLTTMGIDIPRKMQSVAKSIELIYPYVSTINDAFFNFVGIVSSVDQLGDLKTILLPLFEPLFECITILSQSEWGDLAKAQDLLEANLTDVKEVVALQTVHKFDSQVVELITKHESLIQFQSSLIEIMDEFKTCSYESHNFKTLIEKLQSIVNDLFLEGYSNVDLLVDNFNDMIFKLLAHRCKAELAKYSDQYSSESIYPSGKVQKHQIIIQDQDISIKPALAISLT
ncbi:unnamed protein product [Ambrosiozyma monospora]|uniref:Unnamed protein product n=1 Tax=Ambrosiozyma monospora TaxID=43982 RepID=A0ACB5TW60_AMBMO|nr:unnamed protein product [Ambrosiozyma monospora]